MSADFGNPLTLTFGPGGVGGDHRAAAGAERGTRGGGGGAGRREGTRGTGAGTTDEDRDSQRTAARR